MPTSSSAWLHLAIFSGICASLNGLFAKLVTTTLTTTLSQGIAGLLGLPVESKVIEYGVRGGFFALNLVFNGIMWGLFTAALAKGSSATQVSIVNTSSNFVLTAILGWLVFAEKLPALWWLGASMLVGGNVLIGKPDEDEEKKELYERVAVSEHDVEDLELGDVGSSEDESDGGYEQDGSKVNKKD